MEHLPVLIVSASIFLPTLLAVAGVWLYRKWQDRDGRRSPIEGKRIYGAGEQLRKRIDDDTDNMTGGLVVLFFLGPYFLAAYALTRVNWGAISFGRAEILYTTAFLVMAIWAFRRVLRFGNARRRGIAGLKAEMFTAQELNRLMGAGCTVLHDVPGDNFNIDHVVIGPHAVYMIETKSVRKPRDTGKQDHFKVAYDGECLRFPDFVSRSAIKQAKRQAQWLANYLQDATNRTVPVIPTVALPGWYIESSRGPSDNAVRVFNPAGKGANFMAHAGSGKQLGAGTAGLITQALVMRYPVTE